MVLRVKTEFALGLGAADWVGHERARREAGHVFILIWVVVMLGYMYTEVHLGLVYPTACKFYFNKKLK